MNNSILEDDQDKPTISQKFLETLTPIMASDPEFSRVQYLIQMHLGTVDLEVCNLYSLLDFQGSLKQVMRFNEFTEEDKVTILHSVISIDEMDHSQNRFYDVISKGFNIGETGLYFPCGVSQIQISKSGKVAPLLLSKIAIKNTAILKSESLNTESIKQLSKTTRYDSIYVDEKSSSESHPFKENYILLNPDQILPSYLVFVKYVEKSFGLCEVCGKHSSKVFCENDNIDMCAACDVEFHPSSNKVAAKHKRVGVTEKKIVLDFCNFHPKVRKDSFCVICKKSLCINCQLNGFHSDPRFKEHKLISAHDCYEFLKETRKVKSPLMIKIKDKLSNMYSQVKSQTSRCITALDQLEQHLKKIVQETENSISQLKEKYLNQLLSMEVGYRHKLDEIVWMEYFIKYQMDKIKPAEYIDRFFTHLTFQEDFFKGIVTPSNDLLESNFTFELQGNLKIVNKSISSITSSPSKNFKFDMEDMSMSRSISDSQVLVSPLTNDQQSGGRLNRRGSLKMQSPSLEPKSQSDLTKQGNENKDILSKLKLLPRLIGNLPMAFNDSHIVVNPDHRKMLFLNLVKDGSIPSLKFKAHYIHSSMPQVSTLVDHFVAMNSPLLLVLSTKDKVFGAFCDSPWQADGQFGGMDCFIFGLHNNLRLVPIATLPPGRTKRILVFSHSDSFGWGATDLTVDQSFTWMNAINCDYWAPGVESVGPHPLCGENNFKIDEMEVWSVTY